MDLYLDMIGKVNENFPYSVPVYQRKCYELRKKEGEMKTYSPYEMENTRLY